MGLEFRMMVWGFRIALRLYEVAVSFLFSVSVHKIPWTMSHKGYKRMHEDV